jgi:thymidylate kinase
MLIKLSPIFQTYARHKEERVSKALTKQQWVFADRIVISMLFIAAIALALSF